jgi:predicted ATPase
MRNLTVRDFSCIESASLDLGRLTVLIGPQASGKSVLSKLSYFFYKLLDDQFELIQDGHDFASFRRHVRQKFIEWFPKSAWGNKEFTIEFASGDFQVKIKRGSLRDSTSGSMRVWYSQFFEEQYTKAFEEFKAALEKYKDKDHGAMQFDAFYKIRSAAVSNLSKRLGEDFVQAKLFIPAGRSFFTSFGKAVVAFEQGGVLDPATLDFGRFIAAVRDHRYMAWEGRARKFMSQDAVRELFGGEVRINRKSEYVETADGRRVPFSALSSGQQELLPLLFALEFWAGQGERSTLLFIEEPEAHLFPSAQSALVEILASLVSAKRGAVDLVVTTHSPYVLAKINNLVKASELSSRFGERANSEIDRIVSKKSWLQPQAIKAFAMENRTLQSVVDVNGLIAADYLDSVSDSIAREFSLLLDVEIKHEHTDQVPGACQTPARQD